MRFDLPIELIGFVLGRLLSSSLDLVSYLQFASGHIEAVIATGHHNPGMFA
jgi:hypothetical protein